MLASTDKTKCQNWHGGCESITYVVFFVGITKYIEYIGKVIYKNKVHMTH